MEPTRLVHPSAFCWNPNCTDYGQVERGNIRRYGDEREQLHDGAGHYELCARERRCRSQRHAQRHELDRGHGSEVQRNHCELLGDLGYCDSSDGADWSDDGNLECDDARRHGDQRERLHGGANDFQLHAHEWACGDRRDDQRSELHGRDGREVQRNDRKLHGDVGHGDSGDRAGGCDDRAVECDDIRGHSDERDHDRREDLRQAMG